MIYLIFKQHKWIKDGTVFSDFRELLPQEGSQAPQTPARTQVPKPSWQQHARIKYH